jgi:integrase/recombinase XerC
VEDWLAQLAKKGSNAYTIRRLDAVLRGFFQWMTTEEGGWVRSNENNPYSDGKYKTLSPQRPTIKCMTYQEVSNFILHGFEDESERCLIHFMYETGVRVSEVTGILKSDLPLLENYPDNLRYFPIPIRESKGHGGIIIKRFGIISRPMIERVLSLHNNSKVYQQRSSLYSLINQPMFLDTIGNPISTHSIQRKFYLASKKLLEKRIIQEPISPHMLRRATAFSISKSEHRLNSFEKLVLYQQVLVYASIRSIRFYTAAPAAVIAKSQQSRDENGLSDRYQEAEYIIKQTV